MFPNIISSQDRCVAPTRSFSRNSGLGCFAYYPILWFEDARLMNPVKHHDTVVHFYERPSRLLYITMVLLLVYVVNYLCSLCVI